MPYTDTVQLGEAKYRAVRAEFVFFFLFLLDSLSLSSLADGLISFRSLFSQPYQHPRVILNTSAFTAACAACLQLNTSTLHAMVAMLAPHQVTYPLSFSTSRSYLLSFSTLLLFLHLSPYRNVVVMIQVLDPVNNPSKKSLPVLQTMHML